MNDLISRQDAKLKVARVIWEDGDSCYDFHDKCVDCLDDVPSAEPEKPVVHCGECKYYPFGKNNKETRPWCKIFVFEEPRYCSYGKKMDGGEKNATN